MSPVPNVRSAEVREALARIEKAGAPDDWPLGDVETVVRAVLADSSLREPPDGPLAVVGAVYENTERYGGKMIRLRKLDGDYETLNATRGANRSGCLKVEDGRLRPRWRRVEGHPEDQS